MKTLNRPMFRYGGPIKEGIMDGIKEPRQNYKEAGDVKKAPVTNEYKFSETPVAKAGSGLVNYGLNAAIAGAYDLGAVPLNTLGRLFGYNPGFSGTKFVDTLTGGNFSKQTGYDRDKAYFLGPTSAKKGFTTPSMNKKVSDIIDDKGTKNTKTKKTPEQIELEKANALLAKEEFADKEKAKRLENYRKIMDIEGMNKDATYDSLIAASQAVLGEGDFKGSIKDGSLINKIIGSTSKAFDKPKATKQAIDSLILKGEIEKDINQGKEGSQMKAAKDFAAAQGISVTQAYKDLGFSKNKDLSENIAIVNKSIGAQGMNTTAVVEGLRMTYPELGIPVVAQTDSELIDLKKKNELYKNASDAEIFEDLAVKNEIGDGLYVLGTSVFSIKEGKLNQIR